MVFVIATDPHRRIPILSLLLRFLMTVMVLLNLTVLQGLLTTDTLCALNSGFSYCMYVSCY